MLNQQEQLQLGAAIQGYGRVSPGRLATGGCAPCSCQPAPWWPMAVQSHLLYLACLADISRRFISLDCYSPANTSLPTGKCKVVCTPQAAKAQCASSMLGAMRVEARYLWWQARSPLAAPYGMQVCQQHPGPHLPLTRAADPPWTDQRPCTVCPAHGSVNAMRIPRVIEFQFGRAAKVKRTSSVRAAAF